MPDPASNSYGDLNVLSQDPICAGVFLPDMNLPISKTEGHFIRIHFAAPEIAAGGWSLPISGDVNNPLTLTYDGLLKMPSHEITSLMECAGNSRSTMQPPADGVQWDNGGLSVSTWKGVSVKTVLEQAGLKSSVTDVLFVGADSGTESHAEGTMVYEMNGEVLPNDHRFPIRLLIPGWYGMTSVKWLAKIVAMDHPNGGFHEMDYWIYPATDGKGDAKARRVANLKVKSLISTPNKGDVIQPGKHKVTGVA